MNKSKILSFLLASIFPFVALSFMALSCTGGFAPEPDSPEVPVVPQPEPEPEPEPQIKEKPVLLWIDASANFSRLRARPDIRHFLNLAQEAGFNTIIVDVKPVQGDVLYESDFLPKCTKLGITTIENRGYDYLQFFIDEAHKRNMKIIVSTTIMTMGHPTPKGGTGPGYTDPYWDDKFCQEYLPSGIRDIRQTDDYGTVFAFLNPILPEVQAYILRMVEEIVTKYDIDGYALDYCRYMNYNSDFSQASLNAFEKYAGLKVDNFPQDIYTFASSDKSDIKPGKHFNKWLEWRSSVIQGIVRDIKQKINSVKPEVELHYWAASWWPLPHTGQNWASNAIDSTTGNYWWATPDYYKTGFAEYIDIFQLGAYLHTVYGSYNNVSVEYAINRCKRIIGDACHIYGTIQCADPSFDLKEGVRLCYRETEGVMVFELSHIINNDCWNSIKEGIEAAKADLSGK